MSTEREALWTRIDKATFLTHNEKRAAVGYGPVDGGDALSQKAGFRVDQPRVPTGQPGGGQWVGDGGGGLVHLAGDGHPPNEMSAEAIRRAFREHKGHHYSPLNRVSANAHMMSEGAIRFFGSTTLGGPVFGDMADPANVHRGYGGPHRAYDRAWQAEFDRFRAANGIDAQNRMTADQARVFHERHILGSRDPAIKGYLDQLRNYVMRRTLRRLPFRAPE